MTSSGQKTDGHDSSLHLQLTPEQRHEILEEFFIEGEQRPAYAFQFYALSSLSAVIAAAGLILPSTAVVIGAMLISPLMKPILGTAAAMVMGWPQRAIRLIGRLSVGTMLVFAIGYLIPMAFRYPSTMRLTEEILSRTNPELPDLIVALSAGIAAAYLTLRREALAALPGVAVAVALVPAGSRSLRDLGLARYLGPNRTIDTLKKRMVEALHKPVEITVVGSFGFWRSTCPASRACYP